MEINPVSNLKAFESNYSQTVKYVAPNYSGSSLSGKPSTLVFDILQGITRILFFLPSLIFVRQHKFEHLHIPDITKEKRDYYNKILNAHTWDLWGNGPTREQKIQLLHQFLSFKNHENKQRHKAGGLCHFSSSYTITVNGNSNIQKVLDENEFIKIAFDPNLYKSKEPANIVFSFKSKSTLAPTIGPFQVGVSLYKTKNILNKKEITVETLEKRTRNRYSFLESVATAPIR